MSNPIVVTGASGRVGRRVSELLLSAGKTVRVVARNAESLKALRQKGAEIRSGSFQDRKFLGDAFRDARALFLLTPLDITLPDLNAEQKKNVEAIAAAVRESGVRHVVLLSSWGAEVSEGIGGVIACHWFEQHLNEISGLNAVYLRPVWFMENFNWSIGLIKVAGVIGLALAPDFNFPIIATRDIADVAARYLGDLKFEGKTVHYLNGPRNYTMTEIARILGASIGKPGLQYFQFPEWFLRRGLIGSGGLSPNAADQFIKINKGINSGRLRAAPRSNSNTTSTTLEEFAATTFAPVFRRTPNASFSTKIGGQFLRSLFLVSETAARLRA
jgi:uncharacterized protein YbjT (DUF2867 family)